MSNETIVIDANAPLFITVISGNTKAKGMVFRATNIDQVKNWLRLNHPDFKGMRVAITDQHIDCTTVLWKSAKNPEDDFGRCITLTTKLVNPPKIKTLADLTLEEKVEAIIKTLAKQGIKIEVKPLLSKIAF